MEKNLRERANERTYRAEGHWPVIMNLAIGSKEYWRPEMLELSIQRDE